MSGGLLIVAQVRDFVASRFARGADVGALCSLGEIYMTYSPLVLGRSFCSQDLFRPAWAGGRRLSWGRSCVGDAWKGNVVVVVQAARHGGFCSDVGAFRCARERQLAPHTTDTADPCFTLPDPVSARGARSIRVLSLMSFVGEPNAERFRGASHT
jgi:hypothetical protein